jgi:alginate O-acetyltransferase complex protein AlgJ
MLALFKASRLVLPVLLFGYGIAANFTVLTGPPTGLHVPHADLLAGGLTRDFERQYKNTLPHFAPSFGLIGAARYALLGEARNGAVVGRDGWLFTSEETRAVPSANKLAAAVDRIRAVRDALQARGVDLVLLPLPAKIDVEQAHAPDAALSDAMQTLDSDFLTALKAAGVTALNPRDALMTTDKPSFFATDTHWTRAGAAAAAGVVAASLPHGPLTFTIGTSVDKPLTGDLIRYVTEDSLAPKIGLQPERVTLTKIVAAQAPTDIFDAAPVDVVLIGTSYSANTDWGFADALSQALGREVENLAAVGLGPVVPMQAYLTGNEFRDTPAKLVLWEFPIRYLTDPNLWSEPAPVARPLAGNTPAMVAANG